MWAAMILDNFANATGAEKSMQRSSKRSGKKDPPSELVFPDGAGFVARTLPLSLAEITRLSEQRLPFENRKRRYSEAVSFEPFALR